MRRFKRLLVIFAAFAAYVGCSEVSFDSVPSTTCLEANQEHGQGACVATPDGLNTYNISVGGGKVDILFVDDNSYSMYSEQQKMANAFSTLLNAIDRLDYQIAITTTDISASPYNPPAPHNGNGALQDGKFIKFPRGEYILKKNSPDVLGQFQETIKRRETLNCDPNNDCPSGDERGIYALNMALDRGHNQFFRSDAHLAIVILSDEDERADGEGVEEYARLYEERYGFYPLEGDYRFQEYDKPETFISKIRTQLGETRSVSVHPVIVRPGDLSCLDKQNNQAEGVYGFYGVQYARLAQPQEEWKQISGIQNGTLGSICDGNYTSVLQNIGDQLKKRNEVLVSCAATEAEVVMASDPDKEINVTIDGQRLLLDPAVPAYEILDVTFKCPRNH